MMTKTYERERRVRDQGETAVRRGTLKNRSEERLLVQTSRKKEEDERKFQEVLWMRLGGVRL